MNRPPLTPTEQLFAFSRPDPGAGEDLPPPPYQVGEGEMIFVGVRYTEGAARALLGSDLEPAGNDAGIIVNYQVRSGWGVAPFSATYAAVEVKGFDAPDGSPGYYIAAGYYSGGGLRFMRQHYNLNAAEGASRALVENGVTIGIGGPPGVDAVTLRVRPGPPRPAVWTGIHHYLGRRPQGGSCVFAIGFSLTIADSEPLSVDISDAAGERWQLARPKEMVYGFACRDVSLTFSAPQAVSSPVEMTGAGVQVSMLDAFSRIGRAAILVSAGGEIAAMTPQASALLGDGLRARGQVIKATDAADQAALDQLIATAVGQGARELPPIALRRAGGQPLLAEAVSIGPAATGRPVALLLLNDPAQPAGGNAGAALQLLGLTPAETRIAELVGSGLSPREAAERLNNSEGTVRTSLARIYEKLDINRQSELARIVARL